jgi:hypothetical protein
MLRGSLSALMMVVALPGCPGSGQLGEFCGGNDDCGSTLQCLNNSCAQLCGRAPDCGDGFACDEHGYCQAATSTQGDLCWSQIDCPAGLSCRLSGTVDNQNRLLAACTDEMAMKVSGSTCIDDGECRHGACALGHCVDLCRQTIDCPAGSSCVTIPHLVVPSATYAACLPTDGVVTWSIPMNSPSAEILLPVPDAARSAALVMSVDDLGQKVGALGVLAPNSGTRLYRLPCSTLAPSNACDPVEATDGYFKNQVRHLPAFGQSVMTIPSGSTSEIGPGVYRVQVASLRANDATGSAIPHVTAVVRLGRSHTLSLELHFFFLDLADHPCVMLPNGDPLNATTAQRAAFFQDTYLGELRGVFSHAGLSLDTLSFADIADHPELDGVDVADAGDLLSLGKYATGINVFFVRSLSPIGIQAFGPNPGPAGLAGTRQSGIVIGLDTLCYRDWSVLARLTAHEIARYMGLYHNVELGFEQHMAWRDLIDDDDGDDPSNNLMFFSELGGSELSHGQSAILLRSPVLR